jgi:hypothetical protein
LVDRPKKTVAEQLHNLKVVARSACSGTLQADLDIHRRKTEKVTSLTSRSAFVSSSSKSKTQYNDWIITMIRRQTLKRTCLRMCSD